MVNKVDDTRLTCSTNFTSLSDILISCINKGYMMHLCFIPALQQRLSCSYQEDRKGKSAGSMNHLKDKNTCFKKYIWFSDDRNVQEKGLMV